MKINLWAAENTTEIIIKDKNSPVIYSNQTNGLCCYHPEIRGYLVPVEFRGRMLVKFMSGETSPFAGSGWELGATFYDDAPQIMKQLNDYFCDIYNFELDESRINDNHEAWVHLVAKKTEAEKRHSSGIIEGFPDEFSAILTWPNSD